MKLKDFNTVIGNPAAPLLNKLASEGMCFTNYDAVDHPSEPNYLALFQVRSRASAAVILYRQPQGERGGEIFGAARA